MYGEGLAEELVGEAIAGRRDEVFLVTKVYPHNATRKGLPAACERSLRRLRTDRIDLYLLHWPGSVPLAETVEAFTRVQAEGKIRHYGVSNFAAADIQALTRAEIQTNQVLYNLTRRGIEWDLLPSLRQRHIPIMAYSPIEQGRVLRDRKLGEFARRHGMTPAQTALAWLLAKDDVIVIPKTARREKLRENLGALDHTLTAAQLAELDRLFPPPSGPEPLAVL
jgi:diketogulonate reductase-like aldo/keto reductase